MLLLSLNPKVIGTKTHIRTLGVLIDWASVFQSSNFKGNEAYVLHPWHEVCLVIYNIYGPQRYPYLCASSKEIERHIPPCYCWQTYYQSSHCCSILVYNLPLIFSLEKDKLIFLFVTHWQLMISFGHVILLLLLTLLLLIPSCPSQLHFLPTLASLCCFSSVNIHDKGKHLTFRRVSSKQLCAAGVPLCH